MTIGLIELGGGFVQNDVATYFSSLGLEVPNVTAVAVDGGSNAPTGSSSGPDAEVMLDIEVAGAVAPASAIAVYFAPNTDQGFADAVTAAAHRRVERAGRDLDQLGRTREHLLRASLHRL